MSPPTDGSPQSVASQPNRRFRTRVLASIGLILAILALGAGGYAALARLKAPPESREQVEKIYNVEVFEVEPTDLQEIVSGFGTAHADREVVVSAQVSGEILNIHPHLKIGQAVDAAFVDTAEETGASDRRSGDLLVGIDPRVYRERVTQAERRIVEADAELEHLSQEEANSKRLLVKITDDYQTFKDEYERIEKLSKENAATRSQMIRAQLELRQYERTLIRQENVRDLFPARREQILKRQETSHADLELAKLDLKHTDVRPPFSGRLSEVMVEKGQFVRAGDPLVRLIDDRAVEVAIPLTLDNYAKIQADVDAGRLPHVDLAENETAPPRWTGYVVRMAPEADETTRTIKAFVHIDNAEQPVPLLPGMFVHARIIGPVLKQALAVPRDAIVNGQIYIATQLQPAEQPASEGDGQETKPTALLEGQVVKSVADVSRTLQSLALIETGLKPGDRVILTNLDVIDSGTKIRVQSRRNLTQELKNQRTEVVRPMLAGSRPDDDHKKVN